MKMPCVDEHEPDFSGVLAEALHVGLPANMNDLVRPKPSQEVLPNLAQSRAGVVLIH
jgi:hypothetical protein